MKLTKNQILKFLNKKGIEHRVEGNRIILKHCPIDYHEKEWCVTVWVPITKNDWYFACNGSEEHRDEAFIFTEFIRLCEHNIDKIRNKQIKIK